MKYYLVSFLITISTMSYGGETNQYVDPCSVNGDKWSLEPSKEIKGEYIFSYTNSLNKCSNQHGGIGVEAEDGFRVVLYVVVGYNGTENELVYVIPEDPNYMSYPSELELQDSSEPATIRIIPGIS